MRNRIPITEYIEKVIHDIRFAVLVTENGRQPHASLIAVTPMEGNLILLFATYRNTRKYTNLLQNGKVAVLFENKSLQKINFQDITVMTAYGQAEEVVSHTKKDLMAHMSRHPDMKTFFLSNDCAFFRVIVDAYQLVQGIDDVNWWNINDPDVHYVDQ